MLKSAAFRHKKNNIHLHTDLNQEKLGQSLLLYQSKCRINSFISGARAPRVLVALPPSTSGHHSPEGFRTGLGACWVGMSFQEIRLNNSNTNLHTYTPGYLPPLLPREGKKGICINPHRWRYTETWDDQATDVTPALLSLHKLPAAGIWH